ncbi:MAG: glucose-1-phosphate thymidylyltransferase RfbA [Candidatus Omnitrophica bacterium]|nr:glucose-1-phosphate thymidylyltransferase RfbA [Candidatus Omnitrophota bacterium]
MKGIILAGGKATRLYPTTRVVCKQLLPVYNKPMVYYPLSVLMLAGIRDILLISTPEDQPSFKSLIGDGKQLGIRVSYAVQREPKGIAEAFIIGEKFIGQDRVCLILGDNIFFGHQLSQYLQEASLSKEGATIFAYSVKDPQRYGVVTLDKKHNVTSILEKPKKTNSSWAVTGLYFYDHHVVQIAKSLRPSARGEIEISDVNKAYIERGKISIKFLGRGFAWLDTGTHDSLIDASIFIKTIEERQGMQVGCIEEVAYNKGFIGREQLLKLSKDIKTGYGQYLENIARSRS